MSTAAEKLMTNLLEAARAFGGRAEAASGIEKGDLDLVGYGPEIESTVVARLQVFFGEMRPPLHPQVATQGTAATSSESPSISGGHTADGLRKILRRNLAQLLADGLVPSNIGDNGGELLELTIVGSRLPQLDAAADEEEENVAYAAALIEVLNEAVTKKYISKGKHRRILRYLLPLTDEYRGATLEERRIAAGKHLTSGKEVVSPGTIRTYKAYEPAALDELARVLVEMEDKALHKRRARRQ